MVRSTPSHNPASILIHPVVAILLLASWIAATIAVIAALCIPWFRRFYQSKPEPLPESSAQPPQPSFQAPSIDKADTNVDDHIAIPDALPLPPAALSAAIQAQQPQPSTGHNKFKKARSVSAFRRLESSKHGGLIPSIAKSASSKRSLSLRLPDGLAKIRTGIKDRQEKQSEDTNWMKTIILGEKCKVQDDEDNSIDGNRRKLFYSVTSPRKSSASSSRRSSSAYVDAPPSIRTTSNRSDCDET